MNVVTVRDGESRRVLEDVGVEREIEVTADPAILLDAERFTEGMLRNEGIEPGATLVGMSVREPGAAATDLDEGGYHQLLAQAGDFIVHRFAAELVFVAMERDDIRHPHAVVAHMRAADRAQVLKRHYSPQQLLGLMDHLDFVVGMRLHFLMFAAIAGLPFLPLPYAGKVFDFVEAVGMPAPGGAQRSAAGPLLAALDAMWDAREAHRAILRQRVPALQERARRTPDLAVALLDGRSQPRAS